jgi:trans-o-hydroxybenzylidenepyruvate hydratase-aldolase
MLRFAFTQTPRLSGSPFLRKRIRFLPIDVGYYAASRLDPEFFTAFWSSGTVCGPLVTTRFRDEMVRAKAANEWTKVGELSDAITRATMPMFPSSGAADTNPFNTFGMFNVSLEKEKINAAGWMNSGPCRPPHHRTPESYLKGARTAGEMWVALERTLKAEK